MLAFKLPPHASGGRRELRPTGQSTLMTSMLRDMHSLLQKGLAAAPSAGTENACASPALAKQASRPTRVLPSAPDSVLDAPELLLDFYVNILDWSSAGMVRSRSICVPAKFRGFW